MRGVAGVLRARVPAIARSDEDANELDASCYEPGFKLAMRKLPGDPFDLASQQTVNRWENMPTTRKLVRLTKMLVDIYCASYPRRRRLRRSTSTTPSASFKVHVTCRPSTALGRLGSIAPT